MATAMPFIAGGLSIASGAVKAIGAMSSANAGSSAVLQTARANWENLETQANTERAIGQVAYGRARRQGLILRGRSLAALSGAGVDPTEGTPLDLIAEQASESEYAAEVARFQHMQRAWQLESQGSLGIQQANLQSAAYQARGQSEAIGSIVSGLAGGASSFVSFGGGGGGVTAQPVGPFTSAATVPGYANAPGVNVVGNT